MPARGTLESSPAFIVDAMLGSLARKLRIFGYDTLYFRDGSDERLVEEARGANRILVTADGSLSEIARRRGVIVFLVWGSRDSKRLAELARKARAQLIHLSPGEPRCALCNRTLVHMPKREAKKRLPPNVGERHRIFYSCIDCGKLYWRGSHWKRLRSAERLFVEKNAFNQSTKHGGHDSEPGSRGYTNFSRSQKP